MRERRHEQQPSPARLVHAGLPGLRPAPSDVADLQPQQPLPHVARDPHPDLPTARRRHAQRVGDEFGEHQPGFLQRLLTDTPVPEHGMQQRSRPRDTATASQENEKVPGDLRW
jgi:hypothetical protein